ncbi:MAG: CAAX protease [Nodosilinea sp.]
MHDLTFDTLSGVLAGILSLNPDAFLALRQFSADTVDSLALGVVFLAGLSQAIAQSIILFANRVKPLRFGLSLVLAALLFVVGYLFWALSIWLASRWFLDQAISWQAITDSLAFSYLPLVFSFFGAMPYLGVPVLRLLWVWNLLAVVVGFAVLANLSASQAVGHVVLGWIVLLVLQQTVGQPIVNLGRWLTNHIAGVKLVSNRSQLKTLIAKHSLRAQAGVNKRPASVIAPLPTADTGREIGFDPLSAGTLEELSQRHPLSVTQRLNWAWIYLGLGLLALVVALSLEPLRGIITTWQGQSRTARWLADLVWIGAIALVVAAMLAPLEALGWWAGWYGDGVSTLSPQPVDDPDNNSTCPSRFIVYLDGISQVTADYQPAVARYLNDLSHHLPTDIALVRGLISYSVLNRSLTQDRPLAFFWRGIEALTQRLGDWVGLVINLRNILIVAVSADQRFGPIYNQGVAQRVYESLVQAGYPASGGIPLTLIGYSGGGQIALGILPFLKQALGAPIEIISLAGVISGNGRATEAEQIYHLVGTKDPVERLGPVMFPRRWKVVPLSYWNRAKRQGKITFISLGPVGHQTPGGVLDDQASLPDGRSHLRQTLDLTLDILVGDLRQHLDIQKIQVVKLGNYYHFQSAAFNHPGYYPVTQTLPAPWYRPVGNWVGRLVLPEPDQRPHLDGVWLELLHTPDAYRGWRGQRVRLRWQSVSDLKTRFQSVTRDIHFSAEAEESHRQGLILPTRLNHWRLVTPLESLAGAHPIDDIIVKLPEPVIVDSGSPHHPHTPSLPDSLTLTIAHEPIQISGPYTALVQFLEPVDKTLERYRVIHYNPATQAFDGLSETVRLPRVVPDDNGVAPFTNPGLERSPQNSTGWYLYGAQDHDGDFVVKALRPRNLFQLQPNRVITSARQGVRYLRRELWSDLEQKKGTAEAVLIDPKAATDQAALAEPGLWSIAQWCEGDQALLVHVYGGIGGQQREPAAQGPIYFGHFAYGIATVVREPLADELQFDIHYHQVYTHNRRGLAAGTLDWSLYMGDRQWGFMGTRPVSDILIKLPAYTQPFDFNGHPWSALDDLCLELELMTARYRTGDGTGVTYVGPANNCAQDSNQAMYASAIHIEAAVTAHRATLEAWEAQNPDQAQQFRQLLHLRHQLQQKLLPFGSARADWANEQVTLGSNLSDFPLKTIGRGLLSWRTMLPRKASDTITELCLRHGAALWVLRTNQLGGHNPDIDPLAPFTL